MRFTARARLETWAHASRAQSEDETYGMLECVADRAGDSARRGKRTCADGAGSADVVAVEHAARSGRMEMSAWECENRWYARLMKLAHELGRSEALRAGLRQEGRERRMRPNVRGNRPDTAAQE